MRASKSESLDLKARQTHISGAEGLYARDELNHAVVNYILRARTHPRGEPDNITVTIEKIYEKPAIISLLPFSTIECPSKKHAAGTVKKLLSDAGVSEKAIRNGLLVANSSKTMRGASIVLAGSGTRSEPDKKRGVRVSRLGIEKGIDKRLSLLLARHGINAVTVKEALLLASKVASCKGVIAELCVSDDPDYTTGYVATPKAGYIRIANIKDKGSLRGGRIFFVREEADIARIINYLEKKAVLAGKLPA